MLYPQAKYTDTHKLAAIGVPPENERKVNRRKGSWGDAVQFYHTECIDFSHPQAAGCLPQALPIRFCEPFL
jgi:hypothetical protein